MTQSEFNALWTLDDIPACPVGMALLKTWTEALPRVTNVKRLVTLAVEEGIHSDEPAWLTVEQHLSECGDCNKVWLCE